MSQNATLSKPNPAIRLNRDSQVMQAFKKLQNMGSTPFRSQSNGT